MSFSCTLTVYEMSVHCFNKKSVYTISPTKCTLKLQITSALCMCRKTVIAGYCFACATHLLYPDNSENAHTVCQNKKAYRFLPSALKWLLDFWMSGKLVALGLNCSPVLSLVQHQQRTTRCPWFGRLRATPWRQDWFVQCFQLHVLQLDASCNSQTHFIIRKGSLVPFVACLNCSVCDSITVIVHCLQVAILRILWLNSKMRCSVSAYYSFY